MLNKLSKLILTAVLLLSSLGLARAASDSWTGLASDGLWATPGNWSTASTVPGTGETATFNGLGNGFTTIDLGAGVTISSILFDTSGAGAYTIGGGGAGAQMLTLGQVDGGITSSSTVANNQLVNANLTLPTIGFYNLYNDSANTLTLAGGISTATAGSKVLTVDGTGNTTISGLITSGSGAIGLQKTNSGTLTLSGGATFAATTVNAQLTGSALGPVVLRQGTTKITGGTYTVTGELSVGGVITDGGPGNNVNLTMDGGTMNISSWFSIGKGNGVGGVSSDVVLNNDARISTVNASLGYFQSTGNLPKGTLTLNNSSALIVNGNFYFAESAGSDMTMTMNGSSGFTNLSVGTSATRISSSGTARLNLNGGTFFSEGDCIIGYSPSATNFARVVVNGGNLKVASTTKRWMQIGRAGSGSGELIVNSGAVKLCQNTDLRFTTSTSTGTNYITLNGGEITFFSDNASTVGGIGQLDLQQASSAGVNNTFNLNGGTLTVSNIMSSQVNGSRTFNFNGGVLKAASAATSGSVNFLSLGSGNAVANVRNGGAIIDSNGKDITIAQPLLHSGIAGDAATDGGLTKNGAGVLTLTGINTYTGGTTNNQGTLVIDGSCYNSQAIFVADNATDTIAAIPAGTQWAPASMTVGSSGSGTTTTLNLGAGNTTLAPLQPGTLTLNGTSVINVVGGSFVAGNTYPLISYTTLAGAGSYSQGTLPPGVTGTISTSGNAIVLTVSTVTTTNSIWTGALSGTWDINTTANWTNLSGGITYFDGTSAQFDDTGINTTTITNTVATTLKPSAVVVNNTTKNYAFKANTIIAGTTGITKSGTGILTNSTPNTYTGPTVINQGAVIAGVATVPNVSGALGRNSAVTLANDSTAVLNLNNNSTQVGSLAGGGPNAGNVILGSGFLTYGVDNSSTAYSGNISGTGGLTKLGTGTMTFNGTNTYTGATTISQGTVNYSSGAVHSGTGTLTVGSAAGYGTVTLNANSGSSLSFNNVCSIGYLSGSGILNLNGATVNCNNDFRVGASDQNGYGANGSGTVNMTGGFLNVSSITIARGNDALNPVSGSMTISGGTMTITNDAILAWHGAGNLGKMTINSGATVNIAPVATRWWKLGELDTTRGQLDINGGTVNLMNNSSFKFTSGGTSSSGTNVINQNGGIVTYYSDAGITIGGTGDIDLARSGSASANNTYNLNGGTLTVPAVLSLTTLPTRTFNFNGGTLRAAKNNASFFNLGTGNAVANVRNGGAIVDSWTNTVTIAQALVHSTIPGDNATDGGLTKLGAGTLTLSGASTYTGPTRAGEGTLNLDIAGGFASTGALVVSNNASLGLILYTGSAYAGSTLYPSSVNLQGNSALTLSYGTVSGNPYAAAINTPSLAISGTNTINISGTGMSVGVFTLISATGGISTNNFKLGSLPPGIKAVLTNASPTTLDLFITGAGQLLTWYGADSTATILLQNWNIGTSANWNLGQNTYQQYSSNSYGDNVTFDNNVASWLNQSTNVVVSTRVVPATVTFASSFPYSLTGSGGIDGATSLDVTNAGGVNGSVFLGTSNGYTGGTIIGGSTLIVTNDNAMGAASSGVTLTGGTLQLDNGMTTPRTITVTADSSVAVPTSTTASMAGPISGGGGLSKTGEGTLIIGATNSLTGSLQVSQGTLSAPNTNTLPAVVRVGNIAGLNGVLTVPVGGLFGAINNAGQFGSSLIAGSTNGSFGDIAILGGTVNVGQQLALGAGLGGYGALSMSGGALNCGSYIVVGFLGDTAVYNQSGGSVVLSSNLMTIAAGGATSIGVASFSGGTFTASHPNSSGIMVGERGTGTMNVSGTASIITTNSNGLLVGPANSQVGWAGTLNLNGGLVTANKINKGLGTGTAKVNFNGGVIKAAANNGTFLSGMDLATVYGNGLTVDDSGYAITIPQALIGATDYGVSSINFTPGGSGYIDSPIVTISGGMGSNATATATVSGGAVTAITVTSPGTGYTAGDLLTVSFSGGGAGAVAPTVTAVNLLPNTSGSLTKQGSGTVTLAGANTYAGATLVTAGELLITPAHQAGGAVVVSDGAKFGVSASSVETSAKIGALTMGSSTGGTTLDFTYTLGGNPTNAALQAGAVTLNGTTNRVRVAGAFNVGAFPVLKYAGLPPMFDGVDGPRGVSATLSNDAVNSTLYVVVDSIGAGIVWSGTNPDLAKTNVWDLNNTTNWLVGATPTTYLETIPPGDAVLFNDAGSGLVLLSNTASPASVTISNNAQSYTFAGPGRISSTLGLTKTGAGSVTNYLPGSYYGSTVIAEGAFNIASNQFFVNLTGGGTIGTALGAPVITESNSVNTVFSGSIVGAMGLTKIGNGTLTLSGTNAFTGNLWGKAGTIVVDNGFVSAANWSSIGQAGTDVATLILKGTGSFTNNNDLNFGDIDTATGTLIMSNSALVSVASIYVASANSATSMATGTVYQAGGTVQTGILGIGGRNAAYTNALGVYNLSEGTLNVANYTRIGAGYQAFGTLNISGTASAFLGTAASSVGYRTGNGTLNMTGGSLSAASDFRVGGSDINGTQYAATGTVSVANATVNVSSLTIARGNNNQNACSGTVTIGSGATFTSTNDVIVGFAGTGHGNLVIDGGTFNVGYTDTKWLIIPMWDTTTGEMNITNGNLNLNAGSSIKMTSGGSGTAGTPTTINQQGGAVTFYSDFATTVGGGGNLDLQRSGASTVVNTYNLNGGTLTVPQVISSANNGTRVFNFNGGVLRAAGSSTSFFNLNSGNAFAYVRANGAFIDTAGYDVTVTQPLLNNGTEEDGGLTKSSAGTLFLNGVNTYTNKTIVNGGLLGGSGVIAGELVVNSGAGITPGNSIGTLTVSNNITLNAGTTNVFEINGTTLAHDSVVAGGNVAYNGVLKVVPTGTLTAGQKFQLFYGAGATNASNFSSIQSTSPAATFSFADGWLTVVSSMALNPTNLTYSVSGSTVTLTWPADHTGWALETNAVAIDATNQWFAWPGSTSVSTESFTVDPLKTNVFYRLRLP